MREKFKLSDTVKFLTRKINAVVGAGEVHVVVDVTTSTVAPGGEVQATIRVGSAEKGHEISTLVIAMSGKVQRGQKWQDYNESVEVAQGYALEGGHELVIPVVIYIPEDAVLSEDGAQWGFEVRAVLDRAIDPRAEASFLVAGDVIRSVDAEE